VCQIALLPRQASRRLDGRVVVTRLNHVSQVVALASRSVSDKQYVASRFCMRNALVANVLPVARLIRTLIDGDRRASSVVGTREGFLPSVASVSLTVDARRRRVCTRGGFTGFVLHFNLARSYRGFLCGFRQEHSLLLLRNTSFLDTAKRTPGQGTRAAHACHGGSIHPSERQAAAVPSPRPAPGL
jgi:hypothetical protein